MRLDRYLANLGYGTRREVTALLRSGRVTDREGNVLDTRSETAHNDIRVADEPLDPPPGMVLMLNKPVGVTCSHADAGRVIYQLLPPRFMARKPAVSSIGRLDKATSGLLLLTDDGDLLHRVTSPRAGIAKVYDVALAEPLRGDEAGLFASGTLTLRHESTPLAPAQLTVLDAQHVRVTIREGRYHQVRRMFAATGNRVETLHRVSIGALTLGDLSVGQWRLLEPAEVDAVFATVTM